MRNILYFHAHAIFIAVRKMFTEQQYLFYNACRFPVFDKTGNIFERFLRINLIRLGQQIDKIVMYEFFSLNIVP